MLTPIKGGVMIASTAMETEVIRMAIQGKFGARVYLMDSEMVLVVQTVLATIL